MNKLDSQALCHQSLGSDSAKYKILQTFDILLLTTAFQKVEDEEMHFCSLLSA